MGFSQGGFEPNKEFWVCTIDLVHLSKTCAKTKPTVQDHLILTNDVLKGIIFYSSVYTKVYL